MKQPEQWLAERQKAGLLRSLKPVACLPGGMARMPDGQQLVNLASNDYLGMAHHPRLADAMIREIGQSGIGAMASRLVTSGTRSVHTALEQCLAQLKKTDAAVCFSSGYATSVGTVTSLVNQNDVIVMDKLTHASLIDGAKLSGARIMTFLHNDIRSLRHKLESARKVTKGGILIITESVFSMDGDRAPLEDIVRLKDEFDAMLLVDEAHGFGVLGEHGGGLAEETGLANQIDFQMGTLSKAIGVSGGYVACSQSWADVLINSARSLIYSTAPPPSLAAAALESVTIIQGEEGSKRRQHLRNLSSMLAEGLGLADRPFSSIFPMIIGSNEDALSASEFLKNEGFLAPAIRYPTVPQGTARLRISLSAEHKPEQISQLLTLLGRLK